MFWGNFDKIVLTCWEVWCLIDQQYRVLFGEFPVKIKSSRISMSALSMLSRTAHQTRIEYVLCAIVKKWSPGNKPGGTLTCERYTLTTPFSGASAAPETHLFTLSVSSYALRFPFFEKIGIFRPISLRFWQNFSSKHINFGDNSFPRP